MADYTIHTNANPQQLGLIAAETYKKWMEFALGHTDLGKGKLVNPTGKYASNISWRREGTYQVCIVAEGDVANWIEDGAKGFNIKDIMLSRKSHVSAEGYRYRYIPLPPSINNDPGANDMLKSSTLSSFITSYNPNGQRVRRNVARMWAKPVKRTRFKTMSDKPGAADWQIPERPAYSPAQILAQQLKQEYGV